MLIYLQLYLCEMLFIPLSVKFVQLPLFLLTSCVTGYGLYKEAYLWVCLPAGACVEVTLIWTFYKFLNHYVRKRNYETMIEEPTHLEEPQPENPAPKNPFDDEKTKK